MYYEKKLYPTLLKFSPWREKVKLAVGLHNTKASMSVFFLFKFTFDISNIQSSLFNDYLGKTGLCVSVVQV